MDDHYAILGLDRGASRESVRAAYRRLARETHPDHKPLSSENEKALLSQQMAELNKAFAVLYDVKQRREYDELTRIEGMLAQEPSTVTSEPKSSSSASTGQRTRMRPRCDVDTSVVSEFSNHLRSSFLANREHFSWKQKKVEGFDWALEATSWSFRLCVGLRGFAAVNAATVKKFITYSEMVAAQRKNYLRKTSFLFLLPFQQLKEWELVSAQCRRFVAMENGAQTSDSPRGIVLMDLQHGRTLRFDAQLRGKRFDQLLSWIGTPS